MDEISSVDELIDMLNDGLKNNRASAISCSVLLVLALVGGITALLIPRIGDTAPLVGFGAGAILTLMVIGVLKKNRIAKAIAGVLLMAIGLVMTIFILFDFATSLIKGESLMSGNQTAGNYGVTVFIIFMFGIGFFGMGLILLGLMK